VCCRSTDALLTELRDVRDDERNSTGCECDAEDDDANSVLCGCCCWVMLH